jgi:hypothetical protein
MKNMKLHQCQNPECQNIALKDRYGNYKRYCSEECRNATTKLKYKDTYSRKDMVAILKKREKTNMSKYDKANVAQTDQVRETLRKTTTATIDIRLQKTKETNMRNYGVESTNSLPEIKEKKKKTFQERYGVDHQLQIPEVASKVSEKNSENAQERLAIAANTKEERYGDKNYNNREKYVETCLEKFGVENPSQDPGVHQKKLESDYRSKEYIFPSGRRVIVQGHEPQGINLLLKSYKEEDLMIGITEVPRIKYGNGKGRGAYYFPDIYIPKENLIIEVKSQHTYNDNTPKHHQKARACIELGYKFKFLVIEKNGSYYYLDIT